uniref:Uncharacterized protein n=1 Tax=Triticum urartu TaxID=4572 RepID=A0A8R7PLB8_TRIUA
AAYEAARRAGPSVLPPALPSASAALVAARARAPSVAPTLLDRGAPLQRTHAPPQRVSRAWLESASNANRPPVLHLHLLLQGPPRRLGCRHGTRSRWNAKPGGCAPPVRRIARPSRRRPGTRAEQLSCRTRPCSTLSCLQRWPRPCHRPLQPH